MVLTMCISFEYRDWKKRNEDNPTDSVGNGLTNGELRDGIPEDDTEHTALLRNER